MYIFKFIKFLCVIHKRYQKNSHHQTIRLMISLFTTAQHGRLFRLDRGSLIHAVAPNAAVHAVTPPNCFGKHVKTQNQNMQPPKTNMEPNNSWFVDVVPFPTSLFQVPCFGGVPKHGDIRALYDSQNHIMLHVTGSILLTQDLATKTSPSVTHIYTLERGHNHPCLIQ